MTAKTLAQVKAEITEDLLSAMVGPTSGGIARQLIPALLKALKEKRIRHVKVDRF